MYSRLDNDGTQLLRLLISRLANAVTNRPETFISYKEVHTLLGLRQMGLTLGTSLQHQGMDSLAGWAAARGLPAITGLIVNEDSRVPGNSYFTSNGRDPNTDFQWWENEIAKAKAQDWLVLDQQPRSENSGIGNFTAESNLHEPQRNLSEAIKATHVNELSEHQFFEAETTRIADLVYGRVTASDAIFQGVRPLRSAPVNFRVQVAEQLKKVPLACALCGGLMYLRPTNKLLQPSPDRIDSTANSYGPENFQLAHWACNLGKNSATTEQFNEWLQIAKAGGSTDD